MMDNHIPLRIAVIMMACIGALSACSFNEPTTRPVQPPSILEGHVTFGPLTPVIRKDEPTPEVPPEMYADRYVEIFDEAGTTLIARAAVGPKGYFRAELEPGNYSVSFTLIGIEHAKNLPAIISLATGEVITLDISIDTGIR